MSTAVHDKNMCHVSTDVLDRRSSLDLIQQTDEKFKRRISYQRENYVGRIILDRHKKLNMIDYNLLQAIYPQMKVHYFNMLFNWMHAIQFFVYIILVDMRKLQGH